LALGRVIVENTSLPNERIVRTRLDLLEIVTAPVLTDGPAILLIGAAMQIRTRSASTLVTTCNILTSSKRNAR
jgi:siroheme synthase